MSREEASGPTRLGSKVGCWSQGSEVNSEPKPVNVNWRKYHVNWRTEKHLHRNAIDIYTHLLARRSQVTLSPIIRQRY